MEKETIKKKNCLRKIYDWVLSWAETPWGATALFILAFAESSFFPVPPDVLLIALAVSKQKKAFKYALIATIASALGGMFGYFIGFRLWYTGTGEYTAFASLFFHYIPGFTETAFTKVCKMYNDNAFLAVFSAGFTPIPYKIFTIAAGISRIDFFMFVIASIISRGLRFFLVATIIYIFGAPIT
ncbi:MAG TPA: YqaA family protein, partial [Spirochaetota bacterium]|nr:YqaA family protein [Spirochaetota bacterium]